MSRLSLSAASVSAARLTGDRPTERRPRLALLALGLALAACYLLTMSGHNYARDEETAYYITEGLVEGRGFTIPESVPLVTRAPGQGGKQYAMMPPGQSIAAVPLYLAGRLAAGLTPPESAPFVTRLYVQTFNVWMTPLVAVTTAALILHLGGRLSAALLVGLLLGLTTLQATYSRTFFAEPLTALLTLLSLLAIGRGAPTVDRRWLPLAGLAAGLALTVKPHAVLAWPALGLYLLLLLGWPEQRWRWPDGAWWRSVGRRVSGGLLLWLAGWWPPVGLLLFYNTAIFGHPLATGYNAGGGLLEEFVTPPLIGLYGLLIGPGTGLLFFAPVIVPALLGLRRLSASHRWLVWAIMTAVIVHLLFFSFYRDWFGGGVWGPRYLLLILPLLLVPLAWWWRPEAGWRRPRTVMVGLFGLAGLLVALLGAWTNFDVPIQLVDEPRRHFQPAQSAILLHARVAVERWRAWQPVLVPTTGTAVIMAGYSLDELPADAGGAALPLRALSPLTVRVRAAGSGSLALQLATEAGGPLSASWAGRSIVLTPLTASAAGGQRWQATLPPTGGPTDLSLQFPGGVAPLPPLVSELRLSEGERVLTLARRPYIPPMPSAPFRRYQWFNLPNIPHLADHWLWYLAVSGLTASQIGFIAAPFLLVGLALVLAAGWLLWRLGRLKPEDRR